MMFQTVLDALGGTPTDIQKDWAYITACLLLVVGCWAMVKIASWLFHI